MKVELLKYCIDFSTLLRTSLTSIIAIFSILVLIGTVNSAFAQESTVSVVEKKLVTLIGEGFDEDDDVLTFQWEQVSGEKVTLSATDVEEPQFMAPVVENGKTKELVFKLTVTDPFEAEATSSVRIIVEPVNSAPYVDAGFDKVIYPSLSAITLIPTVYDEDHDRIYYHWKQIGGQPISLITSFQKHLTITPGQIDFDDPDPITFELTVNDAFGGTASDTTSVLPSLFGEQSNPLLRIDAGPIQEVDEGTLVTLQGSGQSAFGTPVSFSWSQNVGTPVVLSSPNSATTTFVAPTLPDDRMMLLSFILSGYAPISGFASDIAIVKVLPVNFPPTVDAGEDRQVFRNTKVNLFGSADDPDGDRVSLSWKQTSGNAVSLADASLAQTSFIAPDVGFGETDTLTFQLTATDQFGASSTDDIKITVSAMNRAPFVNAGPDHSVSENTRVTLSATGFDPDNDPITFTWRQISGTTVELSAVSETEVSFMTSDLVPGQKKIFVFGLKGTDPFGESGNDSVTITVIPENSPPTANAGLDKTVNENTKTTLSCQGIDPENDILSFSWTQTAGQPVDISFANTGTISFTTPSIIQNTNLTFECRVSDGMGSATDSVNVMVRNLLNMDIVANAGPDRIVNEKIRVTIDGTQSHDPENQEIFYSWKQTAGESVSLLGATSATPSFTTPTVANNEIKVLVFELRVYDNNGRESFDTVMITVDPINAEPSASASARQD